MMIQSGSLDKHEHVNGHDLMMNVPRRDDGGHNEVSAVVVNVENEAVPKIGEVGPAVDSGYVDSEISDMSERGHSSRARKVYRGRGGQG